MPADSATVEQATELITSWASDFPRPVDEERRALAVAEFVRVVTAAAKEHHIVHIDALLEYTADAVETEGGIPVDMTRPVDTEYRDELSAFITGRCYEYASQWRREREGGGPSRK